MEPVIGLDVSKGSSVMQAFVKRNETLGKAERLHMESKGLSGWGNDSLNYESEQVKNRLSFLRRRDIIIVG